MDGTWLAHQSTYVGAQGITLYYVIWENYTPDQTERDTWEEKAVLASPLTGRTYKQDTITVHNIILRNIADTFTYVKPYIKNDNGRADIKALHSRYEIVAMKEHYVSKGKRTIETIQYINKRAMKFEKFVSKLVKAGSEKKTR